MRDTTFNQVFDGILPTMLFRKLRDVLSGDVATLERVFHTLPDELRVDDVDHAETLITHFVNIINALTLCFKKDNPYKSANNTSFNPPRLPYIRNYDDIYTCYLNTVLPAYFGGGHLDALWIDFRIHLSTVRMGCRLAKDILIEESAAHSDIERVLQAAGQGLWRFKGILIAVADYEANLFANSGSTGSETDALIACKEAVRKFCHDVGDTIGILGGYTEMLNMITHNHGSIDNGYASKLMQRVDDNQVPTNTKFITTINSLKSKSANCHTMYNDILERANIMYETTYQTWFTVFDELKTEYQASQELDKQLIQQLTYKVEELIKSRQSLLDSIQNR